MNRVIACIDSSPCINAIADAAAWVAKATGRELVLYKFWTITQPVTILVKLVG